MGMKPPWYHLSLNLTQGPLQGYPAGVRLMNGNMAIWSLGGQDVNTQEGEVTTIPEIEHS